MQTFYEIGLKPEILESIAQIGFVKPTPVQTQTIPFILGTDKDLIAMAQTGTGKTAAFGLPILNRIDPFSDKVQTIILSPTRELCLQITDDLKTFAANLPVNIVAVYGGAPIVQQMKELKRGCQIVVGTPGRVNDMMNRNKLDLSAISFLVLDEADEMLKMGFKDEMDAILDQTPETKQTLLFSATMPADIARMAGKYMKKAERISVGPENTAHKNISHEYCVTTPPNCYQALRRIADINPDIYSIVFCRTRIETKEIADRLISDGYNADSLHGDLSQAQRDLVMNRFRNRSLQILVATDVAARGLDVDNLTHIIHYHLPDDQESYIHRSGRTARAGKSGISIAIITPGEMRRLPFFERQAGAKFTHRMVPSGREVFEKRLFNFVDSINDAQPKGYDLDVYMAEMMKRFGSLSKEEIIKKFMSLEFNRYHADYQKAPDLNVATAEHKPRRERDRDTAPRRAASGQFTRYTINLGIRNKIKPDTLINIINRQTPDMKIAIGKIDIQQKFAYFETDSQHDKHLQQAFHRAKYKGLPLTIQPFMKDTSKRKKKRELAWKE
ncbi:MAG: DEAD/DEAH box helicase [Bacteroidales bacterium]|jgi:ATP-dependent RNA helicase DeaD|nr:DEAD/DEAH box helicase [Bacteroidales bacterium]